MSTKRTISKASSSGARTLKQGKIEDDYPRKRKTGEHSNNEEDIKALKRENFVKACERVSFKAYNNFFKRFKLIYLPPCINANNCKHHYIKDNPNQIPSYVEESFKIEMNTNMWCEALEVCFLSLTPTQYLSENVLKSIVEIMLNAHEDPDVDCNIPYLLEKCQQILSQHFSMHPPCPVKSIRNCYINFLTSPMDLKENTFTNRAHCECQKGIVKYCMNRLEYELNLDSKDGALIEKYEYIPEEMKQSVKGLHWQKQKFEIYETLERTDRIKRLMAVIESIIELLQFDLAIWHSKYSNSTGRHSMRSNRPLMALFLWPNNVHNEIVNNNCRQIIRLFIYLIHLQYPEKYINILSFWLNAIVETFYMHENNSNSDYPNMGKYCKTFAREFYNIISELPKESILKILERIEPTFMKYHIGTLHIQSILFTKEDNIIQIVINFLKLSLWEKYQAIHNKIELSHTNNVFKKRRVKNVTTYLSKIMCKIQKGNLCPQNTNKSYNKFVPISLKDSCKIDQNYVVLCLYIALDAFLDAFNIQYVQEVLDTLNSKLFQDEPMDDDNCIPEYCIYTVTEHFLKQYRFIYELMKKLLLTLQELKTNEQLPDMFKIFDNIGLL